MLCHSFKGCALPPSLLFHAIFLSPIQIHKTASTIFWRDNQKIVGLGREILYNIQPPNPTQYWSHWRSWGCPNSSPGGPRRSSRLDLPRNLVLERLSHLNLLWDPPAPGVPGGQHASTCPGTQFSGGRHASTCLGIRSIGGCHTSACLGICTLTRGHLAQDATVLGKIRFRKTHP